MKNRRLFSLQSLCYENQTNHRRFVHVIAVLHNKRLIRTSFFMCVMVLSTRVILHFLEHDDACDSQKYSRCSVWQPSYPVLVVLQDRESPSLLFSTAVPFSTFGLSVRLAGCSDSITFDARNTMNSSSTKMPQFSVVATVAWYEASSSASLLSSKAPLRASSRCQTWISHKAKRSSVVPPSSLLPGKNTHLDFPWHPPISSPPHGLLHDS